MFLKSCSPSLFGMHFRDDDFVAQIRYMNHACVIRLTELWLLPGTAINDASWCNQVVLSHLVILVNHYHFASSAVVVSRKL